MSDNPEIPKSEPTQPAEGTNEDSESEILGWFSKINSEDLSNPDREERIRKANFDNIRLAFLKIGEDVKGADISHRRDDLEDTWYDNGRVFLWLGEYIFPEEVRNNFYQVLETGERTPRSSALQGLRVAEIGGNIMVALRHWGADVVSTYEEDIKAGKRRYVNSKNCREILGEEPHHITYSYAVFDTGGGVEKTLGDEYTEAENYAELMRAMSEMTMSGGLSIHIGHRIIEATARHYNVYAEEVNDTGKVNDEAREVFREHFGFEILEVKEDIDNPNFERVVLKKL